MIRKIYFVTFPGFNEKYIGKTDPNIITCLHENGSRIDQSLFTHVTNYHNFSGIRSMLQLPDLDISVVSNAVINKLFNRLKM